MRFHTTEKGNVPFTEEEEIEFDNAILNQAEIDLKQNQLEKIAQIESDFNSFLAQKNIDSIGEAGALLNSTNTEWQNEAAHAIELWDLTWQAFYNNEPLPDLTWS
jgi:hypothetical protein